MNYSNKITDEVYKEFSQCTALFDKKHSDYGKNNISISGQIGIVVRMMDKLARIQNLLNKGTAPENEAMDDSWQDLANYAVIGKLIGNGKWEDLA